MMVGDTNRQREEEKERETETEIFRNTSDRTSVTMLPRKDRQNQDKQKADIKLIMKQLEQKMKKNCFKNFQTSSDFFANLDFMRDS